MSRGKLQRGGSNRSGKHSGWVLTLIAALAVVTFALVATAMGQTSSRQSASTPPPATVGSLPEPSMNPVTPKLQPSDVLTRLDDTARPFNIVMFGDSTGVSRTGWHVGFAEWIGTRFDRPTVIHPWDGTPGAEDYQEGVWTITNGGNASVDIYNASVSSTKSDYPMSRFETMVPIAPDSVDMVMVNYGHNHTDSGLTLEGGALVREILKRYPNAAVLAFLQNAERDGSPHASMLESANYTWKQWLTRNEVFFVDVYTAFEDARDLDAILSEDGDIHPNTEGYELWSSVLIGSLESELSS
jgi:hypothetical protein